MQRSQGLKSLEVLHKYGAELQIINDNGQNILCANILDHNPNSNRDLKPTFEYALKNGINPYQKDNSGKSAYDIAKETGKNDLLAIIEKNEENKNNSLELSDYVIIDNPPNPLEVSQKSQEGNLLRRLIGRILSLFGIKSTPSRKDHENTHGQTNINKEPKKNSVKSPSKAPSKSNTVKNSPTTKKNPSRPLPITLQSPKSSRKTENLDLNGKSTDASKNLLNKPSTPRNRRNMKHN